MSELVSRARAWAIEKHGKQMYGTHPYAYHLAAVANLAAPYGELAEAVAWLHDTIEDAFVNEADVAAVFGDRVARLVKFVTDEPGETRAIRKARTNEKLHGIKRSDETALIVKAADRLANLRASAAPGPKSEEMLAKYRGEHPAFREAAYREGLCEPLWKEIDEIIGSPAGG